MELTTYIQAQGLQVTLTELNKIKTDMATPATQTVIYLKRRTLPPAPPAALTDALTYLESFLLAQAITGVQDQIDAAQTSFDALQDGES